MASPLEHRPSDPAAPLGRLADRPDLIRRHVSELLDCPPQQITDISRIERGERHTVYKVSYDGTPATGHLIVRVGRDNDERDRAQAAGEAAVLKAIGGVAGPALLGFTLEGPWFEGPVMCQEFISGHHQDLDGLGEVQLIRLGSLVARVHALPTDELSVWFPEADDLAAYARARAAVEHTKLDAVGNLLPRSIHSRLNRAAGVMNAALDRLYMLSASEPAQDLVLLHGDVAAGNLLWDPDPVLVDWEYARLGDPADEIAYVFSQNGLNHPRRDAFWAGYEQGIGVPGVRGQLAARVRCWEPISLLGSVLWWIEQWSRAKPGSPPSGRPDHYLDHALWRLGRFEDQFSERP